MLRSSIPRVVAVVAVLAVISGSQAFAFFPLFGAIGEPEAADRKRSGVNTDRLLPHFTQSRANFVVRVNPRSEVLADPSVRDAVLAIVIASTKGMPGFPLEIDGTDETLSWVDGGQTITAYSMALQDLGGRSAEIESIARASGLLAADQLPLHLAAGRGDRMSRRDMRAILGALDSAGYSIGDKGLAVDSEGTPLKIYVQPAGDISRQQVSAMTAGFQVNARRMGVSMIVREVEGLKISSINTTDVLISIENADLHTSLMEWLPTFDTLEEVGEFISALPEQLSPKEQVTSLAMLDEYLTKTGYVVPIAMLPSRIDISTAEARLRKWKPIIAAWYLRDECEGATNLTYLGLLNGSYAFSNRMDPTVILLPREDGADPQAAIWADITQVEIAERGELVFGVPYVPEEDAAYVPYDAEAYQEELLEKTTVAIPVSREGEFLIIDNIGPYLQVIEAFDPDSRFSRMRYRGPDGELHDVRDDVVGEIRGRRLQHHDLAAPPIECLRVLAASPNALTYRPAIHLE